MSSVQEILNTEYQMQKAIVEAFLPAGEVVLFIARQKTGKSTLMRQLGLDVAHGSAFLGRFTTRQGSVLYVDYESPEAKIKQAFLDLGADPSDPALANIEIRSWARLADRDLGLAKNEKTRLEEAIQKLEPRLIILDPLRLAKPSNLELVKDNDVVRLVVNAQQLVTPDATLVIVHHIKKTSGDDFGSLWADPQHWISQVYGGQALLGHVETIIGLERESDTYTLATVPRWMPESKIKLQRAEDSLCFELCDDETLLREALNSPEQLKVWNELKDTFTRGEADAMATKLGLSRGVVSRMLGNAKRAQLLRQPESRGAYVKVGRRNGKPGTTDTSK